MEVDSTEKNAFCELKEQFFIEKNPLISAGESCWGTCPLVAKKKGTKCSWNEWNIDAENCLCLIDITEMNEYQF